MGLLPGGISETAWKWRCKIAHLNQEKTLTDYKSDSSTSLRDSKDNARDNTSTGFRNITKVRNDAKDPGPGSTAAVKTFYEGPQSDDFHKIWVDYPPRQPSKKVALAQGRVALKLYKIKDMTKPVINGKYALKHHMLEIQNPALVAALKPILEDEDVHLDPSEQAGFHAPFRPLYFCYDQIVAKCNSLGGGDTLRPFMLLFIKVMDEIFAHLRQKKKSLQFNGLILFTTAWAYFPRNAAVMTQGPNCQFLCKVIDTEFRKVFNADVLMVRVKALKFTGQALVWVNSELEIGEFAGNKLITSLPHYPLDCHAEPDFVRQRMETRGRQVLDYQGLTVKSRILIDVVGYNEHHLSKGPREDNEPATENTVQGTGRQPYPRCLEHSVAVAVNIEAMEEGIADEENADRLGADDALGGKPSESDLRHLSKEDQDKNKTAMLAQPENLMYMSPLLQGFALKNKEWLSFFIKDIKPIVWNDKAYRHLVYNEQQKDLVLFFVEDHKKDGQGVMDDVIVGKGQGLIILLSGPPGTGKTLMAEAVADRTKRPLFYLQAEDLGISTATLGANIKKVFTMATEWNAVILLDEADVFMAERHPQDIVRNELVSIFLRELEYFRGIIFLTTNLYQTIDSAFRSRVSLHLLFNPLTVEARVQVWHKFLDRIPAPPLKMNACRGNGKARAAIDEAKQTHGTGGDPDDYEQCAKMAEGAEGIKEARSGVLALGDDDVRDLAQWQLNGRKIKNAVKMVKSWCDHKGYEISLSRVENSIKVKSPHASRLTSGGDSDLYD